MKKSTPFEKPKHIHILIICEGYEETEYINRLSECNVWDNGITVTTINAKSISNIFATYEYSLRKHAYNAVMIFCDTELAPYTQFNNLKTRISAYTPSIPWDRIITYANPCTLQIVLSHFEYVKLQTNDKTVNARKIKELVGVENYKAGDKQRNAIMRQVTRENYILMKKNIERVNSSDYTVTPSTNVLILFNALEKCDLEWLNSFNYK